MKQLLLGHRSFRGGSRKFCGRSGVDEFLDGRELDLGCGAECEDEDRFRVEFGAARKIAINLRLHEARYIYNRCWWCTFKMLGTYVNPDAPWSLVQSEDLVLCHKT